MKNMKEKTKAIMNATVIVMMIISAITAFAGSALSDSYETQADWENDATVWLVSGGLTNGKIELGDSFNVTIKIDVGANTCDVWALRNITYNSPNKYRVNATPNGGSAPNINVTFLNEWDNSFADATLNNGTGILSSIGSFYSTGGVTGNQSACLINFTAENCGVVWINQSLNASDLQTYIRDGTDDFTINTQNQIFLTVTPQDPSAFGASAYNETVINLTFTLGEGNDNITICRSDVSYDDISGPGDGVIYNGTGSTYDDEGLDNCTTYYYKAWGWNQTAGLHSATYRQASAMTHCATNFTLAGATPATGSTTANCTYSILVNVTVINTEASDFNYWINASNGQSHSASSVSLPTNIGFTMTGLSHNTLYWWNVTVTDGEGDTTNESYNFTTGVGGGSAPSGGAIYPTSGATSIPVNLNLMSVVVTDTDGDNMNVTFYWGNDTVIGYDDSTASGGTASITPGLSLNYSTRYFWHAVINDTCTETRVPSGSAEYFFDTDEKNISITKTMNVHTNNTIECWINISNIGEANLTNVYVNETYDSDIIFLGANPANETGDNTSWIISFLNMTGYSENWYNITIWMNVSWPLANGSTITNTVEVESGQYSNSATATPLTFCFYATKEASITFLNWNTSSVNFSINVSNCGDFYLNWVQVNETYDANYTYVSSNIVPNATNQTFNITTINPGNTFTLLLNVSTITPLLNSSYHYNNITTTANESSSELTTNTYLVVGAQTERIRIRYRASVTDVGGIGDNVIGLIGLLLIIGAILTIIVVVKKGGFF